jgi:ubiquinone/menaquinone biosynthesis C-methylase UbiE
MYLRVNSDSPYDLKEGDDRLMAAHETTRLVTERYYDDYETRRGPARNDILRNPEVLFQVLAAEASLIAALRLIGPDPAHTKVLDVGCGDGSSLLPFLRLGFDPANLVGIDIRGEKIRAAQARYPGLQFQCADASHLSYPDEAFDIVQESMIFLQIPDHDLSLRIASEMLRITKISGHIVLSDWRFGKIGSREFNPLSMKRISRLFRVGSDTIVRKAFRGALVPPVGRFLSKNVPSMYFAVSALFPFLVGQKVTVLQRVQ